MADITITIANPDPQDCPQTFTELCELFRELITAEIEGASTPYIVQAGEPAVDEQGYIWFKLDANGYPVGIFKYIGGVWRKVYTANTGEVRMFSGDPSPHFDGDGKGVPGGEWDGYQIMNGNNGTTDISDRFIIAGHMNNIDEAGFSSVWRTYITGTPSGTGGATNISLDGDNTYRPAREELRLSRWTADAPGERPDGEMYGRSLSTPGAVHDILLAADEGNLEPDDIPIIPLFYSLAFAQFIGF